MQVSVKIEQTLNEVELFIDYGVCEGERSVALELLLRYRDDALALHLMRAFYSSLPESHEEAIVRIVLIQKKEDIYLLAIITTSHRYLYLATDQKAVLLGEYGKEIIEPQMLALFGYPDAKVFFERYGELKGCAEYDPARASSAMFCPVCSTAVGEHHLLGCPVEVCPWCDGQFSRCGCRFEQLGLDALEDEGELEELERILQEKGRIPYTADQCPSYASASDE